MQWLSLALGHNFDSRHATRSIKGSIEAGDHLVSKNFLCQNFGLLDWHPGSVNVGHKFQKHPHFVTSPQENP